MKLLIITVSLVAIVILLGLTFFLSSNNVTEEDHNENVAGTAFKTKQIYTDSETTDNLINVINNLELMDSRYNDPSLKIERPRIQRQNLGTCDDTEITVAADGSGDYTTLLDAFPHIKCGTSLYIKKGVYYVVANSLPYIPYDDVEIRGESARSTKIILIDDNTGAPYKRTFNFWDGDNVIIRDLTFETNMDFEENFLSAIVISGFPGNDAQQFTISNIFVEGYTRAIELNGPSFINHITVEDSTFIDNVGPIGRTFFIGGYINDIYFINNYVSRTRPRWPEQTSGNIDVVFGPGLQDIDNLLVKNNIIISNIDDVPYDLMRTGIYMSCSMCGDITQIFEGNTIIVDNNNYYTIGVLQTGFGNIVGNTIYKNNIFSGDVDFVVYIQDTTVSIEGNRYYKLKVRDSDVVFSQQWYESTLSVTTSDILSTTIFTWGPPGDISFYRNRYSELGPFPDKPKYKVKVKIYNQEGEYVTTDINPVINIV